jgi:Na+-translocating ferredoxin:NAD+ oxidoreductase subunit C
MTHFVRFRKSSENIRFESPEPVFSGNAFLPSTALIPLLQHSGTPAKPVISPGDRVREGQMIARGLTEDSAHIHSSIPGVLKEFRTTPMPDGTMQETAVIQLSGSFDLLGRREANYPWQNVPESELLKVIEDKGCINTFDMPVPLVPSLREAKKSGKPAIAIRLFDADPTCGLDSALLELAGERVLEGCAILARSIDAKKIYIIHTEKRWKTPKPDTLETFFRERTVMTVKSPDRYPSGNAVQIISLLRAYDPELDADHTILVDPVTALTVHDAVVKNSPSLNHYIFVSGPAIDKPAILKVRIGTPIGDVIEECGGFRANPTRIVVNGLLIGQAVFDLDTPITKYTKSLHIMDRETCPSYTVRNCVHCGRCLQVCPAGIDPHRITASVRMGKITPRLMESVSSCQLCGCCAIVCPSRIPLHHIIKEASFRFGGNNT